jgi:hypothetical protein
VLVVLVVVLVDFVALVVVLVDFVVDVVVPVDVDRVVVEVVVVVELPELEGK